MGDNSGRPIAWVESPLQLVAAAEWASRQDQRVTVAMRLSSEQMPATAEELLARGANFASVHPYYGIPWGLLNGSRQWAIGDAYSGQFRLAGTTLHPRHVTLLDDGALSIAVADSLLQRVPYARPQQHESSASRMLGNLVRDRLLGLAARDNLEIATAFPFGDQRTDELASRGIRVTRHRLEWVRETARPMDIPGDRVLLGSSLPVDGRMPADRYLRWVADEASTGSITYLPHRREEAPLLRAVADIPGVTVHHTGLPVELVLGGFERPVEIVMLPSSAQTTLGYLLEGSGSSISRRDLASV